jgi:hypothetical protein
MSERGVRAIGFLGGVGRKMAVPITLKIPLQIAEGANRRRKLVLTLGYINYIICIRAHTKDVICTEELFPGATKMTKI